MQSGLRGKTAIVTGAAGGIGGAVTSALAAEGVDVHLLDREGSPLDSALDRVLAQGVDAMSSTVDVRRLADFQRAVDGSLERWGRLDLVVNVAGGGTPQSLRTLEPEDWEATIQLNLTGPFNSIKAAAPAMTELGGGSIVTIGSLASLQMSGSYGASYTASKAGVLGLTRHAAFELGRQNIRVNAVLPGPVLSAQMRAKISEERLKSIPQKLPLNKWVQPEDVANAVVFLSSDLAAAVTGTYVIVDGGLHIGASSSYEEYFALRDR